MGSSSPRSSGLSELQRDVLRRFFALEPGFWLTGGGALVGYHLGHRNTSNLDLFTDRDDAFERARSVIPALAHDLGLHASTRQEAPGFRRYVLVRADDGVVVDVVRDHVVQGFVEKPVVDGVRVDPPSEILANKLCALVGRNEERDLIDVMFLEKVGLDVEAAMPLAMAKDGACTPANLGWLLA